MTFPLHSSLSSFSTFPSMQHHHFSDLTAPFPSLASLCTSLGMYLCSTRGYLCKSRQEKTSQNTKIHPFSINRYPNPRLPLTPTPTALCSTRKCVQETAAPHVRPLAHIQVHPGNGAMCDRRHVVDSVRCAVTVIKIGLSFTATGGEL